MGACCAGSRDDESIKPQLMKLTFNDMRGFRPVKDIHALYEFGEKLGAGQFGTVHKAKHLVSGQDCAIKVIEKRAAQKSPVYWDLMKSELAALQELGHAFIVHTMDLVEDRDKIYVIQELMEDGNLLEALG